MTRWLKYGIGLVLLVFLGYHSVYFEKLSAIRAAEEAGFDYEAYADSLYFQGILQAGAAPRLSDVLQAAAADPEAAFAEFGNRLGIGNSAYFMVSVTGRITEMEPEYFLLAMDSATTLRVNTRYVFGNAVRDASRLVRLTDFRRTAEFNSVSEALNRLIRTEILPPVLRNLTPGDSVRVTGAVKLSKKNTGSAPTGLTPAIITPL